MKNIILVGCLRGVYGESCNKICLDNCIEYKCDIISGICLECLFGWVGDFCDKGSIINFEYIVFFSYIFLVWILICYFGRYFWYFIVKVVCNFIMECVYVFNMMLSWWNVEKNENFYIIDIFCYFVFFFGLIEFYIKFYWFIIIWKIIVRCLGYCSNFFIIMN